MAKKKKQHKKPSVSSSVLSDNMRVKEALKSAPTMLSLRNPKAKAMLLTHVEEMKALDSLDLNNVTGQDAAQAVIAVYDVLASLAPGFAAWIETVDDDIQPEAMMALFEKTLSSLGKG